MSKRKEVISWDECFMRLAETVALRSKDPSTQVGACIVNPNDHRIISLGYNGFPFGCSDDEFTWDKDDFVDNKYLYVTHAELNAILSANRELTGTRLYVTHHPCNECMKAIIQSGIKEVIYKNPYKQLDPISIASIKMAKAAGIKITQYDKLIKDNHNPFNKMVTDVNMNTSVKTLDDLLDDSSKGDNTYSLSKSIAKVLKRIDTSNKSIVPKRIMISIGMSGIKEDVVRREIANVRDRLIAIYGDVEVVHNYDTKGNEDDGRLFYLGEAIKKMDKIDSIYMCRGWEKHNGCVVEYLVAKLYNKNIIHE